ncbi:MAG TPA: DUF1638 domain-containing protein [Candidatus Limnocylindrales bacterium]
MRLRVISCEVLARSVYACAATSPHVIDVELLRRGLHDDPPDLRGQLQAAIDRTPPDYDAIVLAYGLCGGATAGLVARSLPVVLPRAHDCITVFLGNRARYAGEFADHPGTYWYVADYVERTGDGSAFAGLGASPTEDLVAVREDYVAKYGEDNADYLMEALGAWSSHYDRAAFIDMGLGDPAAAEAAARVQAERRGWAFERLDGSLRLVRRLIDGAWDDDVLVLQPGERLAMSYDEGIVRAEPT